MLSQEFNSSNDCLILDLNQDSYLQIPQAQSTPKIKEAKQL